jgi:REP element-mobilizing transposase RayT
MTNPRSWVAPDGTRGTFHIISRCARRHWLLHGDHAHRKAWICALMAELLDVFQIDLHAWAVLANHVHFILRPRPDRVAALSAERLTRLAMQAMPARTGIANEVLPATESVVRRYSRNAAWVEEHRKRLGSISWLMKLFKQRISYRANAEDRCRGHFWESRFLSVPLLEMGAIVACMAYVDANPFRAGVAERPEQADWTSLWTRCQADLLAAHRATDEVSPWEDPLLAQAALARHLTPLDQIRPVDPHTGKLPRCALDLPAYLDLVHHACGVDRKQAADARIRRWGIDPDTWQAAMADPGRFQSAAVGGADARKAYAQACGRKWIADKTPIWLPGEAGLA